MSSAIAEQQSLRDQAAAAFDARLRKLHAEGLPDSLLAERLGCSVGRIRKSRARLGLGLTEPMRLTDRPGSMRVDGRRRA